MRQGFPFTAIVGQHRFKLALILAGIDPSIGGVLAVGDKGTGKTTLIRSFSGILSENGSVPFINLPIGASEDRVLGTIELSALINEKKEVVKEGLLAQANNGILYVDEINLLNDYLMDSLLDASATGSYHLEREGVSKHLDSNFLLVGSMNPEEGDLRPQLKDRFGLSVIVKTPTEVDERAEVIRRRMEFDINPDTFLENHSKSELELCQRLKTAKKSAHQIEVPDDLIMYCAQLASECNVEGLRADILLLKTGKAYAAWTGSSILEKTHVDTISALVLDHRKKNDPLPPSHQSPSDNNSRNEQNNNGENNESFDSKSPSNNLRLEVKKGESRKGNEGVGRLSNVPMSEKEQLDVRKSVGQYLAKDRFEPIPKFQESRSCIHVLFVLDATGSTRKDGVIAYAKGFVEKAVKENEGKRMIFSMITMQHNDACLAIDRSSNAGEIIASLERLEVGGKTNAIAAFKLLKSLTSGKKNTEHQLVFLTDGKFGDASSAALQSAISSYQLYAKGVDHATIVDMEVNTVHLGLVKDFADRVKANYERIQIAE